MIKVGLRLHINCFADYIFFSDKREKETRVKEEKQKLAKAEADRLVAEKKKKKPLRYPTEDLDIRTTEKDKKAGMRLTRPPGTIATLAAFDNGFESVLMSWNFLVGYG